MQFFSKLFLFNNVGERLPLYKSILNFDKKLGVMNCRLDYNELSDPANQIGFENELIYEIGIDNLYCFPKLIYFNFSRYWDEDSMEFLTFSVRFSENSSKFKDNINWAQDEEIRNLYIDDLQYLNIYCI